ncbi:MAG TPA: C-GCAxxG-C-C family protein [Candidatus Anoxymicrobiaceae bacterium]|jgi:C_GCAxxG_C_C family probable redox protein
MATAEDYEKVGTRASELFLSGMNCAESVLTANMEMLGVEGDWIPRVASGFGGGIARTCQVCGALTGAVMTLGWTFGRESGADSLDQVYESGSTLIDEFTEKFLSTSCRMLIDVDLSDSVAREKARRDGVFEQQCALYVRFCAERVAEMIAAS